MSETTKNLGGRLPLLRPDRMNGEQKKLYDQINSSYVPWAEASGFQAKTPGGELIGPFNPMLFSPQISESFAALQKQEEQSTALTERLRQVVILSVGPVWHSAYEIYAHKAVARKAGLSEHSVLALAAGEDCDELTGEEQIAQQFTRQLTAQHSVDASLYAAAHSAFGAKGLVDLLMLAGCYSLVCGLLNAFDVPAPEEKRS